MKNLISYLDSLHPLSADLEDYLSSIIKVRDLCRKDHLLKQGRVCNKIHFVQQGLLRSYYVKNDREICSSFMKETDLVFSVESFFKQQPSRENIQALDDCQLYYITYEELQLIYKNYPEFNLIGRTLLEQYYLKSERQLQLIRMHRSSEKYHLMLEYAADLMLRVPSKYIASYIGITEETLSRIRSRV